MGDHEGTTRIEYDDISMKIEPFLTHYGLLIGTSSFDDKSFFTTLLNFTPYWNYMPTNAIHADSPDVYSNGKTLNLIPFDKNN